jgi:hypothetical protein
VWSHSSCHFVALWSLKSHFTALFGILL